MYILYGKDYMGKIDKLSKKFPLLCRLNTYALTWYEWVTFFVKNCFHHIRLVAARQEKSVMVLGSVNFANISSYTVIQVFLLVSSNKQVSIGLGAGLI